MALAISFDPVKRAWTLEHRGLDFADAPKVFGGERFVTVADDRGQYGEDRLITAGFLKGRFVVLAWTRMDHARHIISMRYGHEKEQRRWERRGL